MWFCSSTQLVVGSETWNHGWHCPDKKQIRYWRSSWQWRKIHVCSAHLVEVLEFLGRAPRASAAPTSTMPQWQHPCRKKQHLLLSRPIAARGTDCASPWAWQPRVWPSLRGHMEYATGCMEARSEVAGLCTRAPLLASRDPMKLPHNRLNAKWPCTRTSDFPTRTREGVCTMSKSGRSPVSEKSSLSSSYVSTSRTTLPYLRAITWPRWKAATTEGMRLAFRHWGPMAWFQLSQLTTWPAWCSDRPVSAGRRQRMWRPEARQEALPPAESVLTSAGEGRNTRLAPAPLIQNQNSKVLQS